MNGTWLGYYKYDNAKSQKIRGVKKTFFSLTINSFDGKNFQGTVNDDTKSGGMEDPGIIVGKVDGDKVFFKKLMPRFTGTYPDGTNKTFDKKHPMLYYSGTFSKDRTQITGIWRFRIRLVFLFGIIPIPFRGGKGTWSMALGQNGAQQGLGASGA